MTHDHDVRNEATFPENNIAPRASSRTEQVQFRLHQPHLSLSLAISISESVAKIDANQMSQLRFAVQLMRRTQLAKNTGGVRRELPRSFRRK